MLAHLRNLAIAERRAASDPLTGLPNKRAAEDTMKRQVAQSRRNVAPSLPSSSPRATPH